MFYLFKFSTTLSKLWVVTPMLVDINCSREGPLLLLMYLSCNLGKQGFFIIRLDLRRDLGFSFVG